MKLFDQLTASTVALPRRAKKAIAIALDVGLCVFTVWVAFYLRLGEWIALSGSPLPAAIVAVALAIPIFVVAGLYRNVFRYVSWHASMMIVQAVFAYGILYSAIFTAFGIENVPRTVGIIQPILLLIAIGSSRAVARYWLGGRYRRLTGPPAKTVLIYGAGSAGRQLAAALSDGFNLRVVGFVDDDAHFRQTTVAGVRVWEPKRLPDLVERYGVSEIFLALPSAGRRRRNEVLKLLQPIGVAVRTLPGLLDLAHGRVTVSDLRPLEVDDLLGRAPVAPDRGLLERDIAGQVVVVTGAGGSIGSELCRQIVAMAPATMLLVDASEFALYSIHRDLERLEVASNIILVPLLASVCDGARMQRIFAAWRPHIVYHAAAYKHVPLVEHNPIEGIRNNVLGTWVVAQAARDHGAARFVLVSTDKAVRPTNVMGASKRVAEMALQALAAERPATIFSMVRFGNVLGSSGSVVPLFRQQIAAGGPITVTHKEVTRYFMTIPEAAQLVLHAGAMAKGGEVFVLDMGEPVKVLDLAVRMVELSGLKARNADNPDGEIDIVFTGLRSGEKLYEELLIGNNPMATTHPRILTASEEFLPMASFAGEVDRLRGVLDEQAIAAARAVLAELVPEYVPAEHLMDWAFLEEGRAEDSAAESPPEGEDLLKSFLG